MEVDSSGAHTLVAGYVGDVDADPSFSVGLLAADLGELFGRGDAVELFTVLVALVSSLHAVARELADYHADDEGRTRELADVIGRSMALQALRDT